MGKTFKSSHLFFLVVALPQLYSPSTSSPTSLSPLVLDEDANRLCNAANIPFPFGISGLTPYLSPGFKITCNPTAYLSLRNRFISIELPILEISLQSGFLRADLGPASWRCDRGFTKPTSSLGYLLEGSPFTFSANQNVLTVIGCDAMVILRQQESNRTTGCVSFCSRRESVVDGLCSGVGCCQAKLPEKLKSFEFDFKSIRNMTESSEQSAPCSKAFLLEQKAFEFSASEDLDETAGRYTPRPVVLDWSIGNKSCEEVKRNGEDCICAEKAECSNSSSGIGYLCRCMEGYDGNPYLKGGCKDINECANATNPCKWKCTNYEGGYHCTCPFGTRGDGRKEGSGCKRVSLAPTEIALSAGLCLLLLLFAGGALSYRKLKKKSAEKLKHKHFVLNGGLLLRQQFSVREAAAKIFSAGELESATNNFNESRILGRGGYGTVYRGTLSDGREVAIKKSKLVDETHIEQFINETVILSQTNHRNVVKLLGCCLETPVPLLVYEFISNGTLFERIHSDVAGYPSLSWEIRLRIAAETASALAYIHKAAAKPIIHRDVKSANILLDGEFTAKVSDFGASILVPYDQTHVTTVVQGTLGYLDPEYFHTGMLSEKSDVYSFGVVLVELLTGEKPVSVGRSEEERNLAARFVGLVEENRVLEAMDRRVAADAERMGMLAAAEVARKCLSVRRDDRPMMKEVAVELNALRRVVMMRNGQPEGVAG